MPHMFKWRHIRLMRQNKKLVQNADGLFLAATSNLCFGMDNLHDKMDFTQIVKSTAQEQMEAKNWHGYMQMNSLADFLEKTHEQSEKSAGQPDRRCYNDRAYKGNSRTYAV